MMENCLRRWWNRAWRDAMAQGKGTLVLALVTVLIAFPAQWFLRGAEDARRDLVTYVFWSLAPALAVFMAAFVWNAIHAPGRMAKEDAEKIAEKEQRIRELEEQKAFRSSLAELADLRTECVELRNKGEGVKSEYEVGRWIEECKAWKQRMLALLEVVDPVHAKLLTTLGKISHWDLPNGPVNDAHQLYADVMSAYDQELKVMIKEVRDRAG